MNELVEVTDDSGAGRSVWPKSWKTAGKLKPLKKKVRLVAANGSEIEVLGEKVIDFKGKDGRKCGMHYLVTNVKKPLASVSAIIDQGNKVVFDTEGSYVENKQTGERIKLKRKNGTFIMKLEVEGNNKKKDVTNDDKMDVGGLDDETNAENGFQGQA